MVLKQLEMGHIERQCTRLYASIQTRFRDSFIAEQFIQICEKCARGGGACACFGHALMFLCDAAHTGVVETTSIFHTCSSAVIDMFNIETTRGIQS